MGQLNYLDTMDKNRLCMAESIPKEVSMEKTEVVSHSLQEEWGSGQTRTRSGSV